MFDAILLPAALVIIKMPGHSKFESLETKGNHPADIFTRNAALKGSKPVRWSKGQFPQMITKENCLERPKYRFWKIKKKK